MIKPLTWERRDCCYSGESKPYRSTWYAENAGNLVYRIERFETENGEGGITIGFYPYWEGTHYTRRIDELRDGYVFIEVAQAAAQAHWNAYIGAALL